MRTAFSTLMLAIGLLVLPPPPAFAQDTNASRQQIEQLVERFRTAIVDKDTAGFMQLFLREDITWNVVYTDDSVLRYNARLKDTNIPLATGSRAAVPEHSSRASPGRNRPVPKPSPTCASIPMAKSPRYGSISLS